jgi:hypothetical protein
MAISLVVFDDLHHGPSGQKILIIRENLFGGGVNLVPYAHYWSAVVSRSRTIHP